MPKCIDCDEIYADQLRRCPHCGALPPVEFTVKEEPPLPSLGHVARRNRRRRIALIAICSAVAALSVVISIPAAAPADPDLEESGPLLGIGSFDPRELVPPDELEAADAGEGFAVDRAEAVAGEIVVSGTCSPQAIARVRVAGRPAVLAPDGRSFRAILNRPTPDGEIEVVAEGVKGDRKAIKVPVTKREGPVGPALRLVSHADGSTVHVPEVRVRLLPDGGGEPRDELLKLEDGANEVVIDGHRYWLHLAPAGLTYLRTSRHGAHVFLRDEDGQEMVLVPGGMSYRGMGDDQPHGPRHLVRVSPYLIDRNEVTCAQYAAFLRHMRSAAEAGIRHHEDPGVSLRPAGWESDDAPAGEADLPVCGVSWFAAFAYARWVGGRLPTEAEWERAAAGPMGRPYPWGPGFDPSLCRHDGSGPRRALSLDAGASYYGLLHMAGNVREWCDDRFDPRWYMRVSRKNPRGPARYQHRVVRGGSYATSPETLRCQFRDHLPATGKTRDVGFRVVRRWIDIEAD